MPPADLANNAGWYVAPTLARPYPEGLGRMPEAQAAGRTAGLEP